VHKVNDVEVRDGDIRLEASGAAMWMRKALHDLCQPLTALDCLLYLNSSPGGVDAGAASDPKALHQAIEGAAVECGRMMAMVREMQTRMAADENEVRLQNIFSRHQTERMREL